LDSAEGREALTEAQHDDVLQIDKTEEGDEVSVWTSEPRGEGDGGGCKRLGLYCPARCAVLEESIVDRWQMAFYRQGTGACLMLVDPGPQQKVSRLYVRMCGDCVEAYEAKIPEDHREKSPNECEDKETTAALLQAMLEVSNFTRGKPR
jgi:hypothetical protein